MTRPSLAERIALAERLGYDVEQFDDGDDRIGAVYARVSGAKQALESIYSLKRQRGLTSDVAKAHYGAVITVFADTAGVSGALGPEARPGLQRLWQAMEVGIVDDVFIQDFTRLARAKIIGLEFATHCVKNQVAIVLKGGRVLDPSDELGLVMYVLELAKSEGERDNIIARLQGGRSTKALEGRNPGFNIPTGYYTDPTIKKKEPGYDCFKIYESHIVLPALVLNEVLRTGRNSPKKTLEVCRANGLAHLPPFEPAVLRIHMESRTALFKTPRESGSYVVTTTLIQSIVRNRRWYAGTFAWGGKYQKTPVLIEENHPAIITPAQCAEIDRILDAGRRGPCGSHGVLPLKDLLWSFNAGGEAVPLRYAMTSGCAPRYVYNWEYRRSVPGSATWTLPHHLVDEPVCAVVLDRLVLPDYADRVAGELETNRQDALATAERYRASRERLEQEVENLQTSFAHVSHPDDVASINQQLAQRRAELEQLAAEAESHVVGQQVMAERDIETYREFLADLPALWEAADNELRNRFLRIALKKVYVRYHETSYDARIVWYDGEEECIRVHLPPRYWPRRAWSEEEERYLRENHAAFSWYELAAHLGRKESGVKLRAFTLGLERPPSREAKRQWTAEESDVLERYSRCEIPYDEMRQALPGRCEQGIYSQMKRRGLPQPTRAHWRCLPQSYVWESHSSH